MKELQGDVVILVQPLHHKGLEPSWIVWNLASVRRSAGDVSLVEPFHPEVAVEVGGGLAQSVLFMLLEGVLHVRGKKAPDCGSRELSDIQFLGELIEDRPIGVLVLLYHRRYQGDQLVPELKVVESRSCVFCISLRLVWIDLELAVVELVAVFKEELVGGAETSLHTVFHHCAGSRRGGELLHLHSEESDRSKEVNSGLQVL